MKKLSACILLFSLISTFLVSCSEKNVNRRGVVVLPSDINSTGSRQLIEMITDAGLNLLGIHSNTISPDPGGNGFENLQALKDFLESKEGLLLLEECKRKNIEYEFETHALEEILPRGLFNEHPEYFRMDENGVRQKEMNMCFHSEGAYLEIEKSVKKITEWLKPTSHRYFFWTDDNPESFCHCELCSNYTKSEQALIYENKLLAILRKTDPLATVAHLAYQGTLEAPVKIKPSEGVFLEFAPISRDYNIPLSPGQIRDLKNNLLVFPSATAHVLEYWLDASMHSRWDRSNLVEVPWQKNYCSRDVEFYTALGIRSITCFGTWMLNGTYMKKFGKQSVIKAVNEYGSVLKNVIKD